MKNANRPRRLNSYFKKTVALLMALVITIGITSPSVLASDGVESLKTFTVQFLDDESEIIGEAQQVPQGMAAVAPEAPVREGKDFDGWDTDFSDVQSDLDVTAVYAESIPPVDPPADPVEPPVDPAEPPVDPVDPPADPADPLDPEDAPLLFDVSFDPANGQAVYKLSIADGVACNEPGSPTPNAEMQQIAFIGWFEGEAEEAFDFSTLITKAISLTAKYDKNFLIKYKSAAGGEDLVIDSKVLSPGAPVLQTSVNVIPPANSFVEYWYVEGEDANTPFVFGQPVTRDLTLIPKFSDEYYVIFISEGTQAPFKMVKSGAKADIPANPTRVGFTFKHWSLTQNGGAKFDFNTPITKDTTLYAVWTGKSVTYKVVYWQEKPNIVEDPGTNVNNYDYVKEVNKSAIAGSLINLTNANVDTIQYAKFSHSTPTTILGNGTSVVNVYFKRIEYTLTFNLMQNADYYKWEGIKKVYYYHNASLTLGGKTYKGSEYSFKAKYEQDISKMWPTYPNALPTQTVTPGKNTKTYSFSLWAPPTNVSGSAGLVTMRLTLTSDLIPTNGSPAIFEAEWVASTVKKTVNYWFERLPGQTGETKTVNNITYVKSLEYSQDYYSDGGLAAKKIEGVTHKDTQESGTTSNFFYTRNPFTLGFNTVGGNTIPSKAGIMFGSPLAGFMPANPTRTNYKFDGWFLDAEYNKPFNAATAIQPNANLVLFAKWMSTENKITFYDDLTISTVVDTRGSATGGYIKAGECIYQPGQVVDGKGEFVRWDIYLTNTRTVAFSFDTPISGDISLHAVWKTDGFKVTYSAGTGTGTPPVDGDTYHVGKQTRLAAGTGLTAPAGDNFFVGWMNLDDASKVLLYPGTVYSVSGNTTLTAVYGKTNDYIKLTYNSNYPSGTNSQIDHYVPKNSTTTLAGALFNHTGSTLVEWNTLSNGTGTKYALGAANFPVAEATIQLYAIWKTSGYTITFEAGSGGGLAVGAKTVFDKITGGTTWADAISAVPTTVADNGKYFSGWSPELPAAGTPINQSQTYTAQFGNKASITIKADSATKVYNGANQSVTTAKLAGALLPGHTLVSASASGTGKNVGTYDTTPTGLVIKDASGNTIVPPNYYNITNVDGELEITQAEATILGNTPDKTKTNYDAKLVKTYGDADPTLTATVTGAFGSDKLSYTLERRDTNENVAKFVYFDVVLGSNPNYEITIESGYFSITKRAITITADDKSKVVGTGDPTLTATITPAPLPANCVLPKYDLARVAGEDVGTYTITVTPHSNNTPENGNYAITVVAGNFEITGFTHEVVIKPIANTKIYGNADPTLTAEVTGEVGGEKVNYTLKRVAGENVGEYDIEVVLAAGANPSYTNIKSSATAKFTITQRAITITADDKTKVVGTTDPAFTASVSARGTGVAPTYSLSRVSGETAGKYDINVKAEALANPNYTITTAPGAFTITASSAAVTITPIANTKIYGNADPALKATVTGEVAGAPLSYTLERVAGENVGEYDIKVVLAAGANPSYTNITSSATAKFTITKRAITITADDKTKALGAADPKFTAKIEGMGKGTPPVLGFSRAPGEAASTYAINVTVDATVAANKNYTIETKPGLLTITASSAVVTITPEAATKIYGNADPAKFTAKVTGEVAGVPLNYTLERVAGENVGEYTISVVLGANPSYTNITSSATAKFTITKRAITIAVDDKTKVVGATDPVLTAKTTALGTGVEPTYTLARDAGETAGTYPIIVTADAVKNPNYTITTANGELTITASTAKVVVTPEAATKTYGNADPAKFTAKVTGEVSGVPLNYTLERVAGENVGEYTISVVLGANPSYTNITSSATAKFTITKRAITIAADDKTKVVGATDPVLTAKTTALGTGVEPTYTLARDAGETAGTYPIIVTADAVKNPNYTITTANGELTITASTAKVVVTPEAATKTYGNADPAKFTAKVTGEVSGVPLNYTLERVAGENVGEYTISVVLGANPSYTNIKSSATAKFIITQRAITIAAEDKTKALGAAEPALTVKAMSLGTGVEPTYTLARDAGETAGTYPIKVTADAAKNPNYIITTENGVFTITASTDLVTVTPTASGKTYGDADPAKFTATVTGEKGGVKLNYELVRVAGENVGEYTISVKLGTNPSYTNIKSSATAKFTITQRAITIAAEDKTKVVGAAEPALTVKAMSLGTGVDPTYTIARDAGETAGTYPIKVTADAAKNPNYIITTENGELTITASTDLVTVTPTAATKTYGDADPKLSATVLGEKGGVKLKYTLERVPGEDVNTYTISVKLTAGANPSYTNIKINEAKFTITKRAITIAAEDKIKALGDTDPALTVKAMSLGTGVDPTYTIARDAGETAGTYPIKVTADAAKNPNYIITAENGVFAITASTDLVTVTPTAATKTYGDADPKLSATVLGEKGGVKLKYTLERVPGEDVNTYTISVKLTAGANPSYTNIKINEAKFTITKRAITIAADDKTKVVGAAEPALTVKAMSLGTGVDPTYTIARDAGETAGTYPIIVTADAVKNPNYTITTANGELTITASTAKVVVTPEAATKTYGNADPAKFTAKVTGEVSGVPLNYTLERVAGENVGEYTISVVLGANPSYTNITSSATAKFTITKRAITIAADDKTKVVGATDPVLTAKTTALGTGVEPTYTLARDAGETAGTYPIIVTADAVKNPNYTITTANGELTITASTAKVVVTPEAATKTYGNADPAKFTAKVTGEVSGVPLNYTLERVAGENVGEYTISVVLGANPSYTDIETKTAKFTITKRAITIAAENKTKVVGASDPVLTVKAMSLGTGVEPTYTLARDAGETAGKYPIKVTADAAKNPNYTITTANGELTITASTAKVVVTPEAATKTYGNADPAKFTAKVTGEVSGVLLNYTLVRVAGENVGEYTISVVLGANPSYTNITSSATAKFTITKRTITITTEDKTKEAGGSDPTFTSRISDIGINGVSPVYALERNKGEAAGEYAIRVIFNENAIENKNYTIHQVNGVLTITPTNKLVTVTPVQSLKVFGGVDPTFRANVVGAIVEVPIKYTLKRVVGEDADTYEISVVLTAGANTTYTNIKTETAKFVISKRPIIITAGSANKEAGSPEPTLTATVSNAVAGYAPKYSVIRDTGEAADEYDINVEVDHADPANKNYTIIAKGGKFKITPTNKLVTVTPVQSLKVFGGVDPTFRANVVGAIVEVPIKYTLKRVVGEDADTYEISVVLTAGANTTYTNIKTETAKFVISKRPIIITAGSANKEAGSPEPTLTATVSNAVAGYAPKYSVIRDTGEAADEYDINVEVDHADPANKNYTIIAKGGKFKITPTNKLVTVTPVQSLKVFGGVDPTFRANVVGAIVEVPIKYTLKRVVGEDADTYEISVVLTAGANTTYTNIKTETAKFVISKRPIIITAGSANKEAGSPEPTLTATVSNAVAGYAPKYSVIRDTGEAADEYDINVEVDHADPANKNYTIIAKGGKFKITPTNALVTITPSAASKIYRNANPTLTATETGVVAGVPLNYTLKRVAGEDVGIYQISVVLGANPSYTNIETKTAIFAINKRTVNIVADSFSISAGQNEPTFTAKVTGVLPGDSVEYIMRRNLGNTAGDYEIYIQFTAHKNYAPNLTSGTLTITGAIIPVVPVVPVVPVPVVPVFPVVPVVPPVTPVTPPASSSTPAVSSSSAPESIPDEEIPLVEPEANNRWALINLLLAILCAAFAVLMLVGLLKRNKNSEENSEQNAKSGIAWRILAIIAGVAAPIVFILTENMRNPMGIIDNWTIAMVAILVVQLIGILLLRRARMQEDDSNDEPAAST